MGFFLTKIIKYATVDIVDWRNNVEFAFVFQIAQIPQTGNKRCVSLRHVAELCYL